MDEVKVAYPPPNPDDVLFEAIAKALADADPIGIFEPGHCPPDEYHSEAEAITLRLPKASSASDVQRIVHEVFVRFSKHRAGSLEEYVAPSEAIWRAWQQRQQTSPPWQPPADPEPWPRPIGEVLADIKATPKGGRLSWKMSREVKKSSGKKPPR